MATHIDIVDGIVGSSLLLFTGTEAAMDGGSILELISKFGVVAVLWFWLKDMRKQIKEQSDKSEERHTKLVQTFEQETDELRESYEKIIDKMTDEYHVYSSKMEEIFKEQRNELKSLSDRICDIHERKTNN